MLIQNEPRTASNKKFKARKNTVEYVINYPSDIVPFEAIVKKVCEECDGMSNIEYVGVLSRVLKDLGIIFGSDYYK